MCIPLFPFWFPMSFSATSHFLFLLNFSFGVCEGETMIFPHFFQKVKIIRILENSEKLKNTGVLYNY